MDQHAAGPGTVDTPLTHPSRAKLKSTRAPLSVSLKGSTPRAAHAAVVDKTAFIWPHIILSWSANALVSLMRGSTPLDRAHW